VLEVIPTPEGTMQLALQRRMLHGLMGPLKAVGLMIIASLVLHYFAEDHPWVGYVGSGVGIASMLLFLGVCTAIAFWHRDREYVEIDGARVVVRRKKRSRIATASLDDVTEAAVVLESGVVHLLGRERIVVAAGLGHDTEALDWIARMINRGLTLAREHRSARL
jgi:hypothetical protein